MQAQPVAPTSSSYATTFSIDVWAVKNGIVHVYSTCFKIVHESKGLTANVTKKSLDFDGFNSCPNLCRHCMATYNNVPEF